VAQTGSCCAGSGQPARALDVLVSSKRPASSMTIDVSKLRHDSAAAITEWGRTVPWPTVEQIEQDMLLSRGGHLFAQAPCT